MTKHWRHNNNRKVRPSEQAGFAKRSEAKSRLNQDAKAKIMSKKDKDWTFVNEDGSLQVCCLFIYPILSS